MKVDGSELKPPGDLHGRKKGNGKVSLSSTNGWNTKGTRLSADAAEGLPLAETSGVVQGAEPSRAAEFSTLAEVSRMAEPSRTAESSRMAETSRAAEYSRVAEADAIANLSVELADMRHFVSGHLEWLEESVLEISARVDRLGEILEHRVELLTERVSDLEQYYGVEAQPLVLNDGMSVRVENLRRDREVSESMQGNEAEGTATASALVRAPLSVDETSSASALGPAQAELSATAACAIEVAPPDAVLDVVDTMMDIDPSTMSVPISAERLPAPMAPISSSAPAPLPEINLVPATPQGLQEDPRLPLSLTPLPSVFHPPPPDVDADADDDDDDSMPPPLAPRPLPPSQQIPLRRSQRLSPAPPSPPPPHLRRSPRLSPGPSDSRSRSSTPQPNPLKRPMISAEEETAKRPRLE
jgi:hypothetical protein